MSLSSAGTRFLEILVECRVAAALDIGLSFNEFLEEFLVCHCFHGFGFFRAQQDGASPGALGYDDPAALAHLLQKLPQMIAGFEYANHFVHIVISEVYGKAYISVN